MLGRQFKTVYADASFGMMYYNAKGQQIKQVTPGGMILLAQYDDLGRLAKSAIDMNRNGSIDDGDIYSDFQYAYATRDGKDIARKTSIVCNDTNTTAITEQSLDGLDSWTTANGRTAHNSIVYATDGSGGRTGAKTVTVERLDGSKTVTVHDTQGRVASVANFSPGGAAGNVLTYTYDEFDRTAGVVETFNGSTVNTATYTYDAGSRQTAVTLNGRATSYIYDNMNRRTSVTSPGDRVVNYEYLKTGELNKVYGAETYTQSFAYTDLGSMATLTTYKIATNPQSPASPETTTWTYNNRNFMTAKTYADGKSTTYTYDADGNLLSRLWARGVTTSYAYDNAGRQTGIAYSDSTPDVTLAYDYLNRITSVTDGTGSRTFTYNANSTLASETIPNILNGSMTYSYDSYWRRTGMTLNQNSSAVITNSYTYDIMSKLATVSDGTKTAAYARQPGTNLLTGTTITAGGITKLNTSRTYDALYRLTGISSAAGSVTKAYNYTYDDNNDRRTRLSMADNSYWLYTYDDQGQVKSGIKYDADGKAVPGQYFGYDYDGIGNMTSEKNGFADLNIAYTSNFVNQYTSRTIPGVAPVVGDVDPAAAVKAIRTDVRDPAYADTMIVPARDGKYFSGTFRNIANSTAAVNVTYDVYAIKNDPANNQQLISKKSGSYFVVKTPQLFTYDDDGNMLSDGNRTYTYNAENQLIAIEKNAVGGNMPVGATRLEFAYDFAGRRVSKKVYSWVSNAWSLSATEKYVYDGWNLIAVYDGNNVLQKSYLWGEDASGSLQGAGGVGGLLAENSNSTSYYPAYDGNGNVCAYFDNTGALVAEYGYGPFGNITSQSGTKADDFAFRFSTKYLDKETGLYYYGCRYYSAELKRWINRDPIEEQGGANLYCFVFNSAIDRWDYLGNSPDTWLWRLTGGLPQLLLEAAFGDKGTPASHLPTFKYKNTTFQIIYINGVYNTEQMARASAGAIARKISQKYNPQVGYVLNKTGFVNSENVFNKSAGFIYDLMQVIVQQQLLMADSTSRFLAQKTNETLRSGGCKYVYWVAHSQGGAIIAAAWSHVDANKQGRIRVITAAGANFYGFSGAKSYDAFFREGDIVPHLFGSFYPFFTPVTRHNIRGIRLPLEAHDFVESYVEVETDEARRSYGIGKVINDFIEEDAK